MNPAGTLSEDGVKALKKDAEMFRVESEAWKDWVSGEFERHGMKGPRG